MSGSFIGATGCAEKELGEKISSVLSGIKSIKDEMLKLEVTIRDSSHQERVRFQDMLRRKSGELNKLSDSLVLLSRASWLEFDALARLCDAEGDNPASLERVHALCKEIDVIAADLLCFSLGH